LDETLVHVSTIIEPTSIVNLAAISLAANGDDEIYTKGNQPTKDEVARNNKTSCRFIGSLVKGAVRLEGKEIKTMVWLQIKLIRKDWAKGMYQSCVNW
jgi:hypothetical protein